jgi:hypothetical protein
MHRLSSRKDRLHLGTAAEKAVAQVVIDTARRFNVSKSFVVTVGLAKAFGVRIYDQLPAPDRKAKKRGRR